MCVCISLLVFVCTLCADVCMCVCADVCVHTMLMDGIAVKLIHTLFKD